MKSASKEKLLSYFQNNYQFEIPFFQRGYVWDEESWTLLLEHIEAEVEEVVMFMPRLKAVLEEAF